MRVRLYRAEDGKRFAIIEAFRRAGLPPIQVSGVDKAAFMADLRQVVKDVGDAERATIHRTSA